MTGRENQALGCERNSIDGDSTRQTLREMNSTVLKINYVPYDRKKSKGSKNKQKFQNNSNGSNPSSNSLSSSNSSSAKQVQPSVMGVIPLDITR